MYDNLEPEILLQCFESLPESAIATVRAVCRSWRVLAGAASRHLTVSAQATMGFRPLAKVAKPITVAVTPHIEVVTHTLARWDHVAGNPGVPSPSPIEGLTVRVGPHCLSSDELSVLERPECARGWVCVTPHAGVVNREANFEAALGEVSGRLASSPVEGTVALLDIPWDRLSRSQTMRSMRALVTSRSSLVMWCCHRAHARGMAGLSAACWDLEGVKVNTLVLRGFVSRAGMAWQLQCVHHLDVSWTNMSTSHLRIIRRSMPAVRTLLMAFCPIHNLEPLQDMPTVTTLDVSHPIGVVEPPQPARLISRSVRTLLALGRPKKDVEVMFPNTTRKLI